MFFSYIPPTSNKTDFAFYTSWALRGENASVSGVASGGSQVRIRAAGFDLASRYVLRFFSLDGLLVVQSGAEAPTNHAELVFRTPVWPFVGQPTELDLVRRFNEDESAPGSYLNESGVCRTGRVGSWYRPTLNPKP